MNIQYISDREGKTAGVFIPIEEWNTLKRIFKGFEEKNIDIPDWQVVEVNKRLAETDPKDYLDFDAEMDKLQAKFNV